MVPVVAFFHPDILVAFWRTAADKFHKLFSQEVGPYCSECQVTGRASVNDLVGGKWGLGEEAQLMVHGSMFKLSA